MITRLLVANRGEIALRVVRAAAELGIATVAVHAEDDAAALHVYKADVAVALRGAGVAPYLDVTQLVTLAREHGCDALHPGYGFLSESPDLARACADAGIRFVGPRPELLEAFGDKTRARELAAAAGVPTLAGTPRPVTPAEAEEFLRSLGPDAAIVLKAVSGGGGRGIRRVHRVEDLPAAYERCASEATTSFGRGEIYAERLLSGARHIEVQLLGDGTGAVTHLGERDCSIQRRHQKLVEIAPSPGLSDVLREGLTAAAVRIGDEVGYENLGTVEFLVEGEEFAFLEVNPRLQVEHTVTEEVTGVDLVRAQLRLAGGATLDDLGLADPPVPQGVALQARIYAETVRPDGATVPAAGTVARFDLPSGNGIRVDAAGYPGYRTSLRFDPLLAKLVVHERAGFGTLVTKAYRALCETNITGVDTNVGFLRGLLADDEFAAGRFDTGFLDARAAGIAARQGIDPELFAPGTGAATPEGSPAVAAPAPEGTVPVQATAPGTVIAVEVAEGDDVAAGQPLAVLEAMKMEHVVAAPVPGIVRRIAAAIGETAADGDALLYLEETGSAGPDRQAAAEVDLDHIRDDLAQVLHRHAIGLDPARPDAVARRHRTGHRTARENLEDLCDDGSYVEYGALTIAAQRQRRSVEDLIERTPADGMIAGTASVNADLVGPDRSQVAVMSYDYTVLAGTQGYHNHRKKDRLFELAQQRKLPVVVFAEGGGGRPGDTDGSWASMLDVPAFHLFGKLSGLVPLVGIVSGRCFAGNAALAGCCDVIIATEDANLGMGGPAMIEGGGLGSVTPEEVGPAGVQVPNGVVDVPVRDEAEAVAVARRYLSYFQGPVDDWEAPDQRVLRHVVPENRVRVYEVRGVIENLADAGSVLELRAGFGAGIVTALIRIEGRPMGLIANNPKHLGGAIDRDAADKAARFLQLCDAFALPVVSLVDTPGFMVGPDSEREATVRHFGRMFVVGANVDVPIGMVVLRKCYGLGAQSMGGGSTKAPAFAVSWPTGEFGGMGLEGAVQLGYRKELEAVEDPVEREELYRKLVADMYEVGKATNTASVFEIDGVIDPVETRRWITEGFRSFRPDRAAGKRRPNVDTW